MILAQQLQYLESNYGALAINLTFENIHTDATAADLFRLFLIRQHCCENLDAYEKILEFESMFLCNCFCNCNEGKSISNGQSTSVTNTIYDSCNSIHDPCGKDYDSVEFNTDSGIDINNELDQFCKKSQPVCSECVDKNQILLYMNLIIKHYLSSNSDNELNLPANIKNDVIERLISIQERAMDENGHFFDCQQICQSDRFLFQQVKNEVRESLEHDLFVRFYVKLNEYFAARAQGRDVVKCTNTNCDAFGPLVTITNNYPKNKDDHFLKSSASLASLEKLQMYRKHESLDLLPKISYYKKSAESMYQFDTRSKSRIVLNDSAIFEMKATRDDVISSKNIKNGGRKNGFLSFFRNLTHHRKASKFTENDVIGVNS
eukprot:Awhi_evm1s13867